ncbi:MAG: uroporphyrinogen decarboxylase family protein [Ardenticatenia bacterium]|nr:uroporphyrinogen decarboxylase family protein [Ardenticatenia bacterium]
MKPRERLLASLYGEPVDRPAFSLWRHFHEHDATPEGLVDATVAFVRKWKPDFVKHTPTGLYAVEDWGLSIRRFDDPHRPPERLRPLFETPHGWYELDTLDVEAGALGRELRGLRLLRSKVPDGIPILMTVFSPLTLAYKLVGERVVHDLRQAPEALHAGLRVIAATAARYVEAVHRAGADGLFFATQLATANMLTREEYARFGEPYDRLVLEAWPGGAPLILHLHGTTTFFDLADAYPVHGVSWHDRETSPSLAEALSRTTRGLVAGLDRRIFLQGRKAVRLQALDALRATGGRRHVLAPSCVLPTQAPDEALVAVVEVIRGGDPADDDDKRTVEA